MKILRQTIRKLILEKFSEQDVQAHMAGDTRNRRGKFGAAAKDLFRQQREADPEIDDFLTNGVVTVHWKPTQWTDEFSYELDHEILREPLQSSSPRDELSCSPYLKREDGTPMALAHKGWHDGTKIGIELKGWISWMEHGDAHTGMGFANRGAKKPPSGHNKQPRITRMGADRRKRNSMADVIQTEEDMWKSPRKRVSSFGDGEALVDNWEVVRVWYVQDHREMAAFQASMQLSKRFNKRIPYRQAEGEDQFGHEDLKYTDVDGEWSP